MLHHADQLRAIRNFEDLIRYLEDELDWPLQEYGFEELTFEYAPEELCIKAQDAAKINRIHQLRPLYRGQPWGIFFVEFDHKKLPVVVLRRILSHLVVKKRASANKSSAAAWDTQDLLFISAFGEETSEQREIAFAHFHQEPGDLPSLRVLGWDGADTHLKLAHVNRVLHERLHWPDKPHDQQAWREQWRTPFRHRIGHIINTSDALADVLAQLARNIRDRAQTMLAAESDNGPLRTLHQAFRTSLIHDLSEESFADTYAQTITYGLLTAAISRTDRSEGRHGTVLLAENITDMVPTNPFLKEMLQTFLCVGGRKGGIDFDELGIQDVVELLRGEETDLPAILRDFGNRTRGEDPVIHFYEHFLAAYNKKLKIQRGVFYTPQPVVSYIVRSVHELLQTEFGLEDGLASTITWGEMAQRNLPLPAGEGRGEGEFKIPEGTDPASPFVVILDPATGTATFLVEVIDVIYRTLTEKWRKQGMNDSQRETAWNAYVPKHLLPRLHGYELMMAPYAIAHMKIGLKLHETGYRFGSDERARIYLTNALEPWQMQLQLPELDVLAHEAAEVNEIKRHKSFTVVIGNPPYSKSSGNRSAAAEQLVEEYKRLVSGEINVQPLSDDYVKFVAFSLKVAEQKSSIVAMITNRSYLEGLIHRGLRQRLLSSSSRIFVTDLHGDSNVGETPPQDMANDNIFDITQGVAVGVFVRSPNSRSLEFITHRDIWGSRSEKYHALSTLPLLVGDRLKVYPPYFFFVPKDLSSQAEQVGWISINNLFGVFGMGVKSRRDHFLTDQRREDLRERFSTLANAENVEALRVTLDVTDNPQWSLLQMRDLVRREGVEQRIYPLLYRPFDTYYIWYHRQAIERGDSRWPE